MKRAKKRQPKATPRPERRATVRAGTGDVVAAQRRLGAAIRAGDTAATAKLLAPQFTAIDERGAVATKATLLRHLARFAPARADAGVKARDYGRVVLVTGRRVSARGTTVFFVNVWVKSGASWRVLIRHDNVLAAPDMPAAHPQATPRPSDAPPPRCRNPLEVVPYRPRSKAERDIIASFQALEKAVTHNDAGAWVRHMAEEFVVTRTGQHPTTRAERAIFLSRQHAINAETFVAEVDWMMLWVFGKAAVMRADHVMPGGRRPPYRATRVWVKRDRRWQMAISQQTTIAG